MLCVLTICFTLKLSLLEVLSLQNCVCCCFFVVVVVLLSLILSYEHFYLTCDILTMLSMKYTIFKAIACVH